MTELDEADIGQVRKSCCPECGERVTDESIVNHQLSAAGYLHDDVKLKCSNGHEWVLGVPIGEHGADDMWCDSCGAAMAVHRVEVNRALAQPLIHDTGGPRMKLHLKCPNCYYFDTTHREANDHGTALIANPRTTGGIEDADDEYSGYPTDNPPT